MKYYQGEDAYITLTPMWYINSRLRDIDNTLLSCLVVYHHIRRKLVCNPMEIIVTL